ncbi:hypothetical protein POSPLADRAFT_1032842 [Postia placenta MAD-698-R-SB12]|uniref:F-box domain-containing protein n=1 Tax=Postia placenta MAD-698-R-SB12 TaxID=670580 RepID=A0A1X6N7B0_9APHY|nr:hypothetical protein POSPLADRAFT_1032842 [Postia placenta MAD-698-R-SB12]OSX64518.1 hypothetical protein POSPLADRAFT_1032842 [Postia placenta MAD-698-R-SB12]
MSRQIFIQSETSLRRVSEYSRFFLDDSESRALHIHDNRKRPFAHSSPLFLAAYIRPRTLCLRGAIWTGPKSRFHPDSFFDYLPLFASVTSLWVSSCTFRSTRDLERLLAAFPKLDNVVLHKVDCFAAIKEPYAGFVAERQIAHDDYRRITAICYNSLTFWDVPSGIVASLLNWLASGPERMTIQSLTIGGIEVPSWQHFTETLLPRFKPSLQNLCLPFAPKGQSYFNGGSQACLTPKSATEHVRLISNTKLKVLVLNCCIFGAEDWSHACHAVGSFLSKIQKSQLTALLFELADATSQSDGNDCCTGDAFVGNMATVTMRADCSAAKSRFPACLGVLANRLPIEHVRQCHALSNADARNFFHQLMFGLCGADGWNACGVIRDEWTLDSGRRSRWHD